MSGLPTQRERPEGAGTEQGWRERLAYWWAYRLHDLRCLGCRIFRHDWCEWAPMESNRRTWEYRVCHRCCELDERSVQEIPESERTVRFLNPRPR